MSSAYFAPLVLLPRIITDPGTYRTRCGEAVTVDRTPPAVAHHAFDCFGQYDSGVRERWHRSGRIYATSECQNDIVEKERIDEP